MKKIIFTVLLVVMLSFTLVGCNSPELPGVAWANVEVLQYDIMEGEAKVGSMEIVSKRSTVGATFNNTLNGNTYSSADSRVTVVTTLNEKSKTTTDMLISNVLPIAIRKEFVDLTDSAKSYTLTGEQKKKNFVYSLNSAESKKLKIGASNYAYNEYLYHLLRCYSINSLPTALKVADPLTDSVIKLQIGVGAVDVVNATYTSDVVKSISCQTVSIGLNGSPVGSPIKVWLASDTDTNNIIVNPNGGMSKRIVVKIQENNLVYKLNKVVTGIR